MKIITISREFGSGGRELGRRLADFLSFDYYDREIITAIAADTGMDAGYIESTLEKHSWRSYPLHYRCSFAGGTAMQLPQTKLLLEQKRVIEAIADAGKDCVIVGRNADVLLQAYSPFRIFVCADMDAKVLRCMEREEGDRRLTRRELERRIRSIDKHRRQARAIITDSPWGERSSYHLIVNTTGWQIKELVPAAAEVAQTWFRRSES